MSTIRSLPPQTPIAPLTTEAPIAPVTTKPAAPAGVVPDLPDAQPATNAPVMLPAAAAAEPQSGLLGQMVQQFGEKTLTTVIAAGFDDATCDRFAQALGKELAKIGNVNAGDIDNALTTARKNATNEALTSADKLQLKESIAVPPGVEALNPKAAFDSAWKKACADLDITPEEAADLKEKFAAMSPEEQQNAIYPYGSIDEKIGAADHDLSEKKHKLLTMLSNVLKKVSDTGSNITQNIK